MLSSLKKSIILIFLSVFCVSIVFSQGSYILTETVGARALGMGEAFTAVSDDVNAIYWNPAGIALLARPEFGAMFLENVEDSKYTFLGMVYPFEKISFGASYASFDGGAMDIFTESGVKTVNANKDYVGILSAGKSNFFRNCDAGVSIKMLSSTLIEKYAASSYAVDLGILKKVRKISFGLAIQNIGPGIKYMTQSESLPLTIRTGASYNLVNSDKHILLAAGDLIKVSDERVKFNLGAEYWYVKVFALRVGYKAGYDLDSITWGFGFNFRKYKFDYGVGLLGDFGLTNRMSFSIVF